MNKHILIGRITKDLELEHLGEKQTARVRFDLAVNRKYRNSRGEFDTDFFHCVAFRPTAENIVKYFKKGSLIGLEGSFFLAARHHSDDVLAIDFHEDILIANPFQLGGTLGVEASVVIGSVSGCEELLFLGTGSECPGKDEEQE